jgi:DNA segregation ATPase FtsK/SpoIIIE-like protein
MDLKLYQEALQALQYFKQHSDNLSQSSLQRKLRIGHITAAKILERMEEEGYVTKYVPGKNRKILK